MNEPIRIENKFTRDMLDLLKDTNRLSFEPVSIGHDIGRDISNQHRTIQGVIYNLLLSILCEIGEQPWGDARNQQALDACKFIKQALEDGKIDYQLFI